MPKHTVGCSANGRRRIVVIVLIIWLYITVVVVVISFSIIVLCMFISLLLVTVGIVYNRMGSSISVAISVLFNGENISFDARLVMYMNNISIPPITIMNRMYENPNLLYIVPFSLLNIFLNVPCHCEIKTLFFPVFPVKVFAQRSDILLYGRSSSTVIKGMVVGSEIQRDSFIL